MQPRLGIEILAGQAQVILLCALQHRGAAKSRVAGCPYRLARGIEQFLRGAEVVIEVEVHLALRVALEQRVGAPRRLRRVVVFMDQVAAGVVLGLQARFVVVEIGGGAANRLAEAAPEGVIAVAGDDRVGVVAHCNQALAGIVDEGLCLAAHGARDHVPVGVVGKRLAGCLHQLVIGVVAPGFGGVGGEVGRKLTTTPFAICSHHTKIKNSTGRRASCTPPILLHLLLFSLLNMNLADCKIFLQKPKYLGTSNTSQAYPL